MIQIKTDTHPTPESAPCGGQPRRRPGRGTDRPAASLWRRARLGAGGLALAWAAVVAGPAAAQAAGQPQRLPTIDLSAGMHVIKAEVARTDRERAIGLMHRDRMGTHEGMLFVFEQPSPQCFWMRNTLIPLSIAFLADDGTVVNIEDMKPQSDESHCSAKPVRYALEMNQGWFGKRGIKPGMRLAGAPFQKP